MNINTTVCMSGRSVRQEDPVLDVVERLKDVALVPVRTEEMPTSSLSITINTFVVTNLIDIYMELLPFVSRAWMNLPPISGCRPIYMIIWMLASEDYSVNHNTIRWDKSTPNNFAYVWTIIERMTPILRRVGLTWIVAGRNSVDYCSLTGMRGPADQSLYPPTVGLVASIKESVRAVRDVQGYQVEREFVSLFDFESAMMMVDTWHGKSGTSAGSCT